VCPWERFENHAQWRKRTSPFIGAPVLVRNLLLRFYAVTPNRDFKITVREPSSDPFARASREELAEIARHQRAVERQLHAEILRLRTRLELVNEDNRRIQAALDRLLAPKS
jgi:hypothetical protein